MGIGFLTVALSAAGLLMKVESCEVLLFTVRAPSAPACIIFVAVPEAACCTP